MFVYNPEVIIVLDWWLTSERNGCLKRSKCNLRLWLQNTPNKNASLRITSVSMLGIKSVYSIFSSSKF